MDDDHQGGGGDRYRATGRRHKAEGRPCYRMNKLNAFSIFNKAKVNEQIEADAGGIELRISNRTDDDEDDRTTRRQRSWPLSLIYVYPAGPLFWAFRHKQLQGPFTFCTHCLRQPAAVFIIRPVSPCQSQCWSFEQDFAGTPSPSPTSLSFCILKAISREFFFAPSFVFVFLSPSFLKPIFYDFFFIFYPAIFNNKSEPKKPLFGCSGLFVVLPANTQNTSTKEELFNYGPDCKIPVALSQIFTSLFSLKEKIEFLNWNGTQWGMVI